MGDEGLRTIVGVYHVWDVQPKNDGRAGPLGTLFNIPVMLPSLVNILAISQRCTYAPYLFVNALPRLLGHLSSPDSDHIPQPPPAPPATKESNNTYVPLKLSSERGVILTHHISYHFHIRGILHKFVTA